VTSQGEGTSITEFIACSAGEIAEGSLDHFPLSAGESYSREYQVGNIQYAVDIDLVPRLYESMEDFLTPMGNIPGMKVLTHSFEPEKAATDSRPFTGLAVDPAGNRFFTIHTYPENGMSIISETRLQYSAGA
jgi:hypothetical protein